MTLRTTFALLLACSAACSAAGTPHEIAARYYSDRWGRSVRADDVCTSETSFPGLTVVGTYMHGSCAGGDFLWEGKVYTEGRVVAQEVLRRLDYSDKTPEQRAALALAIASEVAFTTPPLGTVSTSEHPPCAACEPLSGYHAPRAHPQPDGSVAVELWAYWGDLIRYRIEIGRDGIVGAPREIRRLECTVPVLAGKNDAELRCGTACSRASACDPLPPDTAPPSLPQPNAHLHAVDQRFLDLSARLQACTAHCITARPTAEDFACLADHPGTLFIAHSSTLPVQGCRAQRATDLAKTSDPTVLDAILEPLAASARRCEEVKATNHAALKQSLPKNLTPAQVHQVHSHLWERLHQSPSFAASWQQAGLDSWIELANHAQAAQRAHRAAVHQAMTALDTQLLTSSCKAALVTAIPKSDKQCASPAANPTDWLRTSAARSCATRAASE